MVKKLKTLAENEESQFASAVRTSAQQIWQAGLGAFAKAQEEGGRVFNKLVQEGTELQKRTRVMAEDKASDVSETVAKVADGVSKQAAGSWDKLEQVFEDRVSRALGTIGVPTQKDIQELTRQVEQLSRVVAELSGKRSAEPAAKPAKASARKAAAKPAKPARAAKPAVTKTPSAKAAPRKAPSAKAAAKKAPARKAAGKKSVAGSGAA